MRMPILGTSGTSAFISQQPSTSVFPLLPGRILNCALAANTHSLQSSPESGSPVNEPQAIGSSTARPASPTPPGGPKTAIRRKAAADRAEKVANVRPNSTRAAGAGGSSNTMLSKSWFDLARADVPLCGDVAWISSILLMFELLHTHRVILTTYPDRALYG